MRNGNEKTKMGSQPIFWQIHVYVKKVFFQED